MNSQTSVKTYEHKGEQHINISYLLLIVTLFSNVRCSTCSYGFVCFNNCFVFFMFLMEGQRKKVREIMTVKECWRKKVEASEIKLETVR